MKYIKKTIVDASKITKYILHIIYKKEDKIFFIDDYSVGRLLNKNDYLIFENGEIFKLDEKSFEEQFERYYA